MKPFTSVIEDKLCATLFVAFIALTIGLNVDIDQGDALAPQTEAAATSAQPTATARAAEATQVAETDKLDVASR